jgi:hypothetical protein
MKYANHVLSMHPSIPIGVKVDVYLMWITVRKISMSAATEMLSNPADYRESTEIAYKNPLPVTGSTQDAREDIFGVLAGNRGLYKGH